MKKIYKQILIIITILTIFVMFDIGFYSLITKRFINKYGDLMKEKSIELNKYLPFDNNSLIVKVNSNLKLEGNLPTLDGATALFSVYSAFMNAIYPENSVEYVNGDFTEKSLLKKRGTNKAFKAVVDGEDDIIFCAKPSKEQLEYAHLNSTELEMIPIGSEAFVFIVNSKNPVNNLTLEQVKGIYTRKYTKWAELDGDNSKIIALQREIGSGSQTTMLSLMNNQQIIVSKNMFIGKSIGYSFRYYVNDIVSDSDIKMISLNGIFPNEENIKNGSYPIIDNFYAIYRKDNTNENITKVIDWILSDEGQFIINKTGYIGVN